MKRTALYFHGARQVEVREEQLPPLSPDRVLVQTICSAISAGTEMLAYRGQIPSSEQVDTTIPALSGTFKFPLKYGYSAIGRIIETGKAIEPELRDRLVFSFHPHENLFTAALTEIMFLPEDISPEDAVFLPSMETAINLVMDGKPSIGEQVAVFGQGVIGLLTTVLLAQFPLASLITFDLYPLRRKASVKLGAHSSLDPVLPDALARAKSLLRENRDYADADLTYELSGNPTVLNTALDIAGFNSRLIIGSWYGNKTDSLHLDTRFHRQRLHISSSQVSTIAPELSGRWNKSRRFQTVWESLAQIKPSRLITHRFPINQAAEAYALLDNQPEQALQIIFTY